MRLIKISFFTFWALLFCTYAYSDEVKFEEGKVSLELPKTWTFKTVDQRTPTGQLIVHRWIREAINYHNIDFYPGISARAIPLEQFQVKDADKQLALLSGMVLQQSPYNVDIFNTECLKCVKYEGKDERGDYTGFSNSIPAACDKKSEKKPASACTYETINKYSFNLEPSWILRFKKDANGSKLNVDLIHFVNGNNLVEISFWYPADLEVSLAPEMIQIIQSIKPY
jgi:hypothetical protein